METFNLPGVIELDTDEMIAVNGGVSPGEDESWCDIWELLRRIFGGPVVGGGTGSGSNDC